ncbi:hypothetical protein [Litorisediminicola beolgyonensis]|uniref:Lipoprotein n=1 Tax=Litorisediminicola beolgyonensis TaxID=1173614 RepID=A0ABW3ZN55_9RHOB
MSRCALLLCLLLSACTTASPGFYGAAPIRIDGPEHRFIARRKGALMELIRTDPALFPQFPDVAKDGAAAALWATGCHAAWIRGDPSMMILGLSCPGAAPPPKPRGTASFSCEALTTDIAGGTLADISCQRL